MSHTKVAKMQMAVENYYNVWLGIGLWLALVF